MYVERSDKEPAAAVEPWSSLARMVDSDSLPLLPAVSALPLPLADIPPTLILSTPRLTGSSASLSSSAHFFPLTVGDFGELLARARYCCW